VGASAIGGWFRSGGGVDVRPWVRVAAAHVVALLATLIAIAVDGGASARPGAVLSGLLVFLGFSVLRVATVNRRLAITTLLLDAVGTALLLASTDAPASAYTFLAFAGAWWAAHVPRRRTGLVWAVAFVGAYAVLVLPGAIRDRDLVSALEEASVVMIVGVLSDWLVRVDRRALELNEMLGRVPEGAETVAIREGLTRALGPMELSLDVLLAAARAGLTVIQAELLAYLQMGLTNQEIAEATKVSEATVRYRLTGLYRTLGVHGRKAAVEKAMALAIDLVAMGRPTVAPR